MDLLIEVDDICLNFKNNSQGGSGGEVPRVNYGLINKQVNLEGKMYKKLVRKPPSFVTIEEISTK